MIFFGLCCPSIEHLVCVGDRNGEDRGRRGSKDPESGQIRGFVPFGLAAAAADALWRVCSGLICLGVCVL